MFLCQKAVSSGGARCGIENSFECQVCFRLLKSPTSMQSSAVLFFVGGVFLAQGLLVRQPPASWAPEAETGFELYKYPQGSSLVTPCPVEKQAAPGACAALFEGKGDGERCPQNLGPCPKALGREFKLVCGGGCCPVCWAPDHLVSFDRHSALDNSTYTVATHPAAPPSCAAAKCFTTICPEGHTKGYKEGDCCYSCVPGL